MYVCQVRRDFTFQDFFSVKNMFRELEMYVGKFFARFNGIYKEFKKKLVD